jgi:hypothetical protein
VASCSLRLPKSVATALKLGPVAVEEELLDEVGTLVVDEAEVVETLVVVVEEALAEVSEERFEETAVEFALGPQDAKSIVELKIRRICDDFFIKEPPRHFKSIGRVIGCCIRFRTGLKINLLKLNIPAFLC